MRTLFFCVALLSAASFVAADEGRVERFSLDNGLELVILPDSSSETAYIELVFKGGAEKLSASDAGAFDLIQRLVIAELSKSKSASAVSSSWKGYAKAECIGFSSAIVPARMEQELSALASVLLSPRFDAATLESCRSSALAALAAAEADPNTVYEAAVTRRLFSKYPWRRFPMGCEKTLRDASVESLDRISEAYLKPSNAVLVIAAPVQSDSIRAVVDRVFGGWKAAASAPSPSLPAHPRPGVARPTWLVYPDPSMPSGSISVELRYRGPDAAVSTASVLASHVWAGLVSIPEGRFMTSLDRNAKQSADSLHVTVSAETRREGGTLSIAARFEGVRASSIVDIVRDFKEQVRGFELTDMRSKASYCSQAEYEAAKAALAERHRARVNSPQEAVRSLADMMSMLPFDFFTGYVNAISSIGSKEITAFVDTYFLKNLEVIAVRCNPDDYARQKSSFSNSGFELISPSNAFWRQ
jgi:zinc protease